MGKRGYPAEDLTGRKFGQWKVLNLFGRNDAGKPFWRCQCSCGTIVVKRPEVLKRATKGCCDRCHNLAKPEYREVARLSKRGLTQVEIARRLGKPRQRVHDVVKVIEGREKAAGKREKKR